MRYISNHKGETLLFSRLKHLESESGTVTIVSSDNASFEVSKFVFTFFSDIFHDNHDCIIAPLSSSSLSLIVDFINLHKDVNLSKESSNYIQYILEEAELLGLNKESLNNLFLPSSGRNEYEPGAGRKILVKNGNKPQLEKKNIKTDYALNKVKAEKPNELDEEEEGQISISVNKNETENDVQSTKNSSEIIQDNLAERKNYVQEEVEHHSKKIQIGNKCKRSNKKEKISVKKEKKTKKNSKTKKKEKVTKKINVSEEKEKKLKVRGNPIQHFGTLENGKRLVESLQCRLCGDFFYRKKNRFNAYNNHYEKHEILLFTCDCDYKSSTYWAKRKHFKTVHQNRLGCPIKGCPAYKKTESGLKKHLDLHKNTCDICNFETNSKYNLKLHYKRMHDTTVSCDMCNFVTTEPYHLKKHMERMHVKSIENNTSSIMSQEKYACKNAECDQEFNNPYTLDNHMRKVHNPQPCPICGKIVKMLHPHLKTHATNEDKDFHCDQCGKGFNTKKQIEEHIQVIHNGIMFHCRYPNCKNNSGSGFSGYRDSSNRSAHERKHHGAPYTKYQESVIL